MGAFDDLIPGGLNVTSSDGQAGVGTKEAATREAQYIAAPQRRALARDLAQAAWINRRLPTGRFSANVNSGVAEAPSSWQNGQIANFQTMQGLQQAMTKPIITMSSAAPSSKEMDAVKEQEMAASMIPGPSKEYGANVNLINRAGRTVLDQEAYSRASDNWRSMFGSVHHKSKTGKTFQQFWTDYTRSPAYKQTVMTPYTQLMRNGGRASPPKLKGGVSDDVEAILKKRGL